MASIVVGSMACLLFQACESVEGPRKDSKTVSFSKLNIIENQFVFMLLVRSRGAQHRSKSHGLHFGRRPYIGRRPRLSPAAQMSAACVKFWRVAWSAREPCPRGLQHQLCEQIVAVKTMVLARDAQRSASAN